MMFDVSTAEVEFLAGAESGGNSPRPHTILSELQPSDGGLFEANCHLWIYMNHPL